MLPLLVALPITLLLFREPLPHERPAQIGDGVEPADDGVELQLDAEALQALDFVGDDGLGQAELGDAVDQHPADLAPNPGPGGDYALVEVATDHWVGCWRTPGITGLSERFPDLDYRIADDASQRQTG
jgi:hypothetical protein